MIGSETSVRLAKILPMLGSNIDAEVLAAVEAMRRVLLAGAADFHDLADALTQGAEQVTVFRYPPPRPAPQPAHRAPEPPKPKPPFRAPSPDDPAFVAFLALSRTFARTHEARDIRQAVLVMLSIDGAPIKPSEQVYLQLIVDECYRQPHTEIRPDIKRRLDAIRRRVMKHLVASSSVAA